MNKEIFIKKRGGALEKFNADKINKVLQWATEGIKNVSFEEVAICTWDHSIGKPNEYKRVEKRHRKIENGI